MRTVFMSAGGDTDFKLTIARSYYPRSVAGLTTALLFYKYLNYFMSVDDVSFNLRFFENILSLYKIRYSMCRHTHTCLTLICVDQ